MVMAMVKVVGTSLISHAPRIGAHFRAVFCRCSSSIAHLLHDNCSSIAHLLHGPSCALHRVPYVHHWLTATLLAARCGGSSRHGLSALPPLDSSPTLLLVTQTHSSTHTFPARLQSCSFNSFRREINQPNSSKLCPTKPNPNPTQTIPTRTKPNKTNPPPTLFPRLYCGIRCVLLRHF